MTVQILVVCNKEKHEIDMKSGTSANLKYEEIEEKKKIFPSIGLSEANLAVFFFFWLEANPIVEHIVVYTLDNLD